MHKTRMDISAHPLKFHAQVLLDCQSSAYRVDQIVVPFRRASISGGRCEDCQKE